MGKKAKVLVDVVKLGRAGGFATAANRTPEERKAAARQAVQARWAAYYAAHPEKAKAKKAGRKKK